MRSMRKTRPSGDKPRRTPRERVIRAVAIVALSCPLSATAAPAASDERVLLDPFARASSGFSGCVATPPPLLTPEQMRIVAHERVERGTSCALEGKCEPGGAYRRDAEINERVRAAIAEDKRLADTALWVTTSRRFVTVSGCVRSVAQRRAVETLVLAQPGVDRVFNEIRIGSGPKRGE
jgi:BON domain